MNTCSSIPCPICQANDPVIEEVLTGAELRRLWNAVGQELSDAALAPISRDFEVRYHRCRACGFRYFDPSLAGGSEFYEELMAGRPYPESSPEFAAGIRFAMQHGAHKVLDVGGGTGSFLDLAKKAGLETLGIELNRDASQVAASKGHRMVNTALEEVVLEDLGGGVDMLTLFQVVEHVPDPVGFVRSAACLVRPGGYLLVAVPSSKRMLGLLHHDPLDWPPHHISRWRPNDLALLGRQAGLELIEQGYDPLLGRSIVWATDLHARLEKALGRRPVPLPRGLARLSSLIYRGLRMKLYMPFHSLSIHAIYRKPA